MISAVAVLALALTLVSSGLGLNADGVALLAFRYAVLDDPLEVLDGWDYGDESPCGWTGVVCAVVEGDPEPSVVGLVLPGSQLLGSIPNQLGGLQHLRRLDLSLNFLNGTLPPSLFNAAELRILSLSGNKLSGGIPPNLGALQQLQYVNLSDNAFAGAIPTELTAAPALRFLSLSSNYFSGQIPAGFGTNSQPLQALDLSSNLLNGSLPSEIGTVRYLNLSSNRLSGPIPPDIGRTIPANATLDLSYNNFSGPVPVIGALLNQKPQCLFGNPGLCGGPLKSPCSSVPATLSNPTNAPTSTPAIAVIPQNLPQQPRGDGISRPEAQTEEPHQRRGGLALGTIAGIVIGGFAALTLACMCMLFIYRYQVRTKMVDTAAAVAKFSGNQKKTRRADAWRCSCLRAGGKGRGGEDDESISESTSSVSESEDEPREQKSGRLVKLDGDSPELELDRLLKASAYILGASGSGILYKAVLDDGTALAVRRVGESTAYRMKDFENRVKLISKLKHPNLSRLRAFYWSSDQKLLIYDFAPNGSLASFPNTRKPGSSPTHLMWAVRFRIGRGIARGLAYLHEKKCVHGNVKPSNVLLGPNMEPWIGDLELDRLVHGNGSSSAVYFNGSKRSSHSRDSLPQGIPPAGTQLGGSTNYQAPEALKTLRPNLKWDVYSFGVLFLELITGRPVTETELGIWKESAPEERNRALKMVDPSIRSEVEEKEEVMVVCIRLGLACVSAAPQRRPSMKEVVKVLEKIPTSSSFLNSSSFSSSSSYY